MDTPLHSRDKETVKTMGFWRWAGSSEDGQISQQGYGYGFLATDYLEKGQTITETYYAPLLHRLSEEIKKKRSHLKKIRILFHHDNARVYACTVSMAKMMELKFELSQHPPDLASSDFFIFPYLKKWLGEDHRPNRCLFRGPSEILLFGRLKKDVKTLGKVYRVKKRLCWKIKKIYTIVHYVHVFYFMWLRCVYEFLCIH